MLQYESYTPPCLESWSLLSSRQDKINCDVTHWVPSEGDAEIKLGVRGDCKGATVGPTTGEARTRKQDQAEAEVKLDAA